ncbi:MAG: GNAT family N-acetyltransferase [Pseudomonadota bacterium]
MNNESMNNTFTIKSVTWQTSQRDLIMLRTRVFLEEQNVSPEDEWDNKDETATHFLVTSTEGAAIGCARLLVESLRHGDENSPTPHQNQTLFHIGRVAVLKSHRQQGIGKQLMQTIINECLQSLPSSNIYLYAQTARIKFYQQLGFVIQGDVFMDAGIPHIEMWYKPKK